MGDEVRRFLSCCERVLHGDAQLLERLRGHGFACAAGYWEFGLPALHGYLSGEHGGDYRRWLQRLYADTFAQHRLDALVFPTTPKVAMAATPDASSVENFVLYIQNTDPGSNAGIPGLQLPMGMGTQVKVPVGLELDGPTGSDRRLVAIGMAVEAVLGRLTAPSASVAAR